MRVQRSDRDEILDGVASAVADLGVRRTTMSEVARRAGRSRSTCYRHFTDVNAAAAELITREIVQLLQQAQAANRDTDGRTRIVSGAVHLARSIPGHAVLRRVLELDAELLVPYLTQRLGSSQRAILTTIEQYVREGQADGSIRTGDPALLAATVLLIGQSFTVSGALLATEHGREAVLAELDHALDRALAS